MTEDFISDPYKNWIRFDFAAPWERGRTSIYNHVLVGKDGEAFEVEVDEDLRQQLGELLALSTQSR